MFAFILIYLLLEPKLATDSLKYDTTDIVLFGGKSLTYFAQEEKVIIIDSAWIRYREMSLFADSIEYDTKRHLISAFPRKISPNAPDSSKGQFHYVTFKTTAETIIGFELHYNVNSRKGMMRRASTEVTNGFFQGEEIWLVKEKTLNVNQGYYTTCDRSPPHYHFFGSKVRVLMDDMVIAQPVVLKIGKVPIAIAPFWFFPIGKNRKSGLSPFKVGQSNVFGYYAKGMSYYWVINDYSDMTFGLDFMMKKGFYPKMEGRYIVNPFAQGQLLLTYIREFDTKKVRYSLQGKHSSVFFFDSDLTAYADYQSDERLISDYTEDRIEWLKKELFSYAQLSRSFRRIGKGTVFVQHRRDFTLNATEILLPKINIGFYSRPIFRTWNISPGISFNNNILTIADSLKTENRSAGLNLGIAPPPLPFGPLDISQSFGYNETKQYKQLAPDSIDLKRGVSSATGLGSSQKVFQSLNLQENLSVNENIRVSDTIAYESRYSFSTGADITLYKIFGIEGLGLHGVLHQVTPSIAYSVTPRVRQKGFLGIPRLDTIPETRGLSFSIANLFQGKIGEDKIKRDLCYINFNSSYDFLQQKLAPIGTGADFFILQLPGLNLTVNINTVFDLDSLVRLRRITDYSTQTNFYYSLSRSRSDTASKGLRNFSINLTHFLKPQSNMLTANLAFTLPGWAFNIATGSNLKRPWPPADINLSIVKDLHCWELLITGSGMGTRWAYDFKLRIKKIPEVSIGKGILNFVLP
uniref:LPS-assembly protein LptD n=1 Tax=candidate division WOR-3 bacterium TaxID=2052148 RepID=A0A7C6ED45_UNCW3